VLALVISLVSAASHAVSRLDQLKAAAVVPRCVLIAVVTHVATQFGCTTIVQLLSDGYFNESLVFPMDGNSPGCTPPLPN
jgi:hypothetical protein